MKRIVITAAMATAVENAIRFEHGYEVIGHTSMIRAMAYRGLVRMNNVGGTLTDRGMWLYRYLNAGFPLLRSFYPSDMDECCGATDKDDWDACGLCSDCNKGE